MPYICTDGNRYIGEHNCHNYHNGNMELVRPCCVEDALKYKNMTLEKAITGSHPAYRMFSYAWNSLTDAEREIVGDIESDGFCNGFKEVKK